jgi:hypothetical protein
MPFRQGCPLRLGLRPRGGHSPQIQSLVTAGQSHRLTSGGIAVTQEIVHKKQKVGGLFHQQK